MAAHEFKMTVRDFLKVLNVNFEYDQVEIRQGENIYCSFEEVAEDEEVEWFYYFLSHEKYVVKLKD